MDGFFKKYRLLFRISKQISMMSSSNFQVISREKRRVKMCRIWNIKSVTQTFRDEVYELGWVWGCGLQNTDKVLPSKSL